MEEKHHHDNKGCEETMETTTVHEFSEGKYRQKNYAIILV